MFLMSVFKLDAVAISDDVLVVVGVEDAAEAVRTGRSCRSGGRSR